jgi:NAD(P)-dependent dehydrogenase (short-subunit alcohol dehydrogenase family)
VRRFDGKVALVTGAAGGIGAATARAFAREGAHAVLADVSPRGAEVVREIVANGGTATFVRADVSRAEDARRMAEAAERIGRLDVVFNNAAIPLVKGLLDTSEEEWDRLMSTNLKGVFLTIKATAPLLERSGGTIVNNASTLAVKGDPSWVVYSAAKGGILAMSRALARELAPRGIRVVCVCPGTVETAMLDEFLSRQPDPEATRDQMVARRPIQRLGHPEDVAEAVLYLASDAASWITGTALFIDGGSTA